MTCTKCQSSRVATISAKCADLCTVSLTKADGEEIEYDGFVPVDMGLGAGDFIEFSYCLKCGTIQGDFPLDTIGLESEPEEAADEEPVEESDS